MGILLLTVGIAALMGFLLFNCVFIHSLGIIWLLLLAHASALACTGILSLIKKNTNVNAQEDKQLRMAGTIGFCLGILAQLGASGYLASF